MSLSRVPPERGRVSELCVHADRVSSMGCMSQDRVPERARVDRHTPQGPEDVGAASQAEAVTGGREAGRGRRGPFNLLSQGKRGVDRVTTTTAAAG